MFDSINFETVIMVGGTLVFLYLFFKVKKKYLDPNLEFSIEETQEIAGFPGKNTRKAKFLKVTVSSKGVGKKLHFLRSPAPLAQGILRFHDLATGELVYDMQIPVRFPGAESQYQVKTNKDGTFKLRLDGKRFRQGYVRTIDHKNPVSVIVAANFDGEAYSFYWINSENSQVWKSPQWKLEAKQYIVSISLRSLRYVFTGAFLLDNTGQIADFALQQPSPEQTGMVIKKLRIKPAKDPSIFLPSFKEMSKFPYDELTIEPDLE